jgi:HlyD family secretion protein
LRKRLSKAWTFLKSGIKDKKKRKFWIPALIFVAMVLVLALRGCAKRQSAGAVAYTEAAVETRNITESLSASGTLEPADSYTVTTLVKGNVLSADFEEGDVTEKDAVLYQIDSSDASSSIQKAQISLEQSQRSYEDAQKKAYVTADTSGTVYSLNVKVGDEVTQGQAIATVRDSSVMTLKVPFPSDDAASFYVGEKAVVTLDGTFETLSGTVREISGSDTVLTGNMIVRSVTIQVSNPGGLTDSQVATAAVNSIGSSSSGTLSYKTESTVSAAAAGTVSAVNAPEGSNVSKGQSIVTLSGDDLSEQIQSAYENLENAQISLDNQSDQLDNYTITSPIAGTIVDKECKAGDKVESGDTLCTIYDLSYLTMTMDIDELDISKVSVGQTVQITADAVEGKTYEGKITKVSVAGTTSNGTTTYPVTVQIDDTDGLMPGMNVNAVIIVAESDGVLAIPNAAVTRGDLVLVTGDSPSAVNATKDTAPDGYAYVQVETGLSDDDYVEITSGLQQGDTVAYAKESSSNDDSSAQTGLMIGGGQGGGQMPSGGGPGGGDAPSGGGPGGGPNG